MLLDRVHNGADFERLFLGSSYQDYREPLHVNELSSREHCFRRVEANQHLVNCNPSRPKTKYGREFLQSISLHLPHSRKQLKLFIATGFQLDKMWCIDFFVKYEGKRITVDLTVTKGGKEDPFADHVLTLDDLKKGRHIGLGAEIAEQFKLRKVA